MDAGIVVVSQKQVSAQDATGAYVPAVRVTFTVDGQGPFSVDQPVSTYSPDTVGALVTTYAQHVRGVAQLGR